jgi:hypothetical protein
MRVVLKQRVSRILLPEPTEEGRRRRNIDVDQNLERIWWIVEMKTMIKIHFSTLSLVQLLMRLVLARIPRLVP